MFKPELICTNRYGLKAFDCSKLFNEFIIRIKKD